jgi:hypothetical protein
MAGPARGEQVVQAVYCTHFVGFRTEYSE